MEVKGVLCHRLSAVKYKMQVLTGICADHAYNKSW